MPDYHADGIVKPGESHKVFFYYQAINREKSTPILISTRVMCSPMPRIL